MASPTQWTWVWASSGSWWWTGRPGVLQSMGVTKSQTPVNWTEGRYMSALVINKYCQKNVTVWVYQCVLPSSMQTRCCLSFQWIWEVCIGTSLWFCLMISWDLIKLSIFFYVYKPFGYPTLFFFHFDVLIFMFHALPFIRLPILFCFSRSPFYFMSSSLCEHLSIANTFSHSSACLSFS